MKNEPINLLDPKEYRITENEVLQHLENGDKNCKVVSKQNGEYKAGDTILFVNGYGVEMISKILGFDSDGRAYLVWDCWWFTLEMERIVKKVV